MHRFIVYQYGKVGSTAVVETLNTLPDVEAHQVHFFGPSAFEIIFNKLLDPELSDYFFEHSSGQLLGNMRVYRQFIQARDKAERVSVFTMFREPFDWFRSCIAQEIEDHINTFRYSLEQGGVTWDTDEEAVTLGLELLLARILRALELAGGVDNMSMEARNDLARTMDFADDRDLQQFLFLLGRFLAPHFWFSTNLRPALNIEFQDMEPLSGDLFRGRKAWGSIYLMRYETLQQAFESALRDLGYDDPPQLVQSNISADKPFNDAINTVFASPMAQKLKRRCQSETDNFLGYGSLRDRG
jgi:hypothetical protein